MDPAELAFAGIAAQAELIRAGELSARELVDLYLARIDRIDPRLRAFRAVFAESARAEADRADAARGADRERPLHGVPVAVKDELDVAGDVTTFGTDAFGPVAPRDSEVVRRLREAGAIVIGKTTVPELTIWPFTESSTWGATCNPWDPDRSPGGSSGGSGAAVAAGLVGAALGTDGLGSIRIPAACCGLFGLKPQRGRVSYGPLSEHWYGLSVVGSLTRTVADTALLLDCLSGGAPGDAAAPPRPAVPFLEAARQPPGRLRIAVSTKTPLPGTPLGDDPRRALDEAVGVLRSLGHEVREEEVDYPLKGVLQTVARYFRGVHDDAAELPRAHRLERRTQAMARAGGLIPRRVVDRARAEEAAVTAKVGEVFAQHDVVLTPLLAQLPLRVGQFEGRGALRTFYGSAQLTPYTPTWNGTGQPAAAVPTGFTAGGLPLSVQLVGRPNDEGTLLALAAQLEAERPWAQRRPPLAG